MLTLRERLREGRRVACIGAASYLLLSIVLFEQGALWSWARLQPYRGWCHQSGLGETTLGSYSFTRFGLFAYALPWMIVAVYRSRRAVAPTGVVGRLGWLFMHLVGSLTLTFSVCSLLNLIGFSGGTFGAQGARVLGSGTPALLKLLFLLFLFSIGYPLTTGFPCPLTQSLRLLCRAVVLISGVLKRLPYLIWGGIGALGRLSSFFCRALQQLAHPVVACSKVLYRAGRLIGVIARLGKQCVRPRGPLHRIFLSVGRWCGHLGALYRALDRFLGAPPIQKKKGPEWATELDKAAAQEMPSAQKGPESATESKKGLSMPHAALVQPSATYKPLTLDLLEAPPAAAAQESCEVSATQVKTALAQYHLDVEILEVQCGPAITRYELALSPGTKVSALCALERDLARNLSVASVRVVEVIPGKSCVGLELPNPHRKRLFLKTLFSSEAFISAQAPLTAALGQTVDAAPCLIDLAQLPHLLVAGTTGSGKSMGLHTLLLSLLYKSGPDQLRLILIDPKLLELSIYAHIPHLLCEVITDMAQVIPLLEWCIQEMETRYQILLRRGVRDIGSFNAAGGSEKMPYLVLVIDEFSELMMVSGKRTEGLIIRLAQKARAAGIHLILTTQRPSVDVITGVLKANIPARLSFTLSSKIDSRTILDQAGAESLLGAGDMLYAPGNANELIRLQGPFVHEAELSRVMRALKAPQS